MVRKILRNFFTCEYCGLRYAAGRFARYYKEKAAIVVVVVVVFTLKAVPVSTQYFLTSVLVQPTRTPSVVTG